MQHGTYSTMFGLTSKVYGLYLRVWCEEIVPHWGGSINHLILMKLGHEIILVIIVRLSLCLISVPSEGPGSEGGRKGLRKE